MELRAVGSHEVDLIEQLFQDTYNKEQGISYWRWCFENPYGYITSGIFDDNRLLCYQAFNLTKNSGCSVSVMTHPKFRKQGLFMQTSDDLMERVSHLRDYIHLFSNEMIRPIHRYKEGYTEVYQIREYRVPFDHDSIEAIKGNYGEFTGYELWRYRIHPTVKYIFHYDKEYNHKAIYSIYDDRVQIIDFNDDIQRAIEIGNYIAYAHKKSVIAFWSEVNWDYPSVLIPTWKHYKILNPLNIGMDEIMKNDKLRMGMSDVY